jgi:tetratricopeptide (TPR) repeat protein
MVLSQQKKFGEAKDLIARQIEMLQKTFPKGHPLLAAALNLRGNLERETQDPGAEKTQRLVLEMRLKLYPRESPEVSSAMNNLAVHLINRGQFDEAEELLQQALAIQEKMLGADVLDPSRTAVTLGVLAVNLRLAGVAYHPKCQPIHPNILDQKIIAKFFSESCPLEEPFEVSL